MSHQATTRQECQTVYEASCSTVYKSVCVDQYKTEYEPYTETECTTGQKLSSLSLTSNLYYLQSTRRTVSSSGRATVTTRSGLKYPGPASRILTTSARM